MRPITRGDDDEGEEEGEGEEKAERDRDWCAAGIEARHWLGREMLVEGFEGQRASSNVAERYSTRCHCCQAGEGGNELISPSTLGDQVEREWNDILAFATVVTLMSIMVTR